MDWLGAEVADATGRRYGRLDEVFVGRGSGEPAFGIVTLLEPESGRVAVPLRDAQRRPDGALALGVPVERVLDAPRVQRDVDEIPSEAGRLILQHFGLRAGGEEETVALDAVGDDDVTREMVRHEEQLAVGTVAEPTTRVRVRKHVVTEDVTVTVTLRREELVIERTPIDAADVPPADATDFAFAEEGAAAEFVLHAEEPVVTKRVVPVERVRLHRETTVEDRHVTDTVRKERIEVEDDLPPTREDPTP